MTNVRRLRCDRGGNVAVIVAIFLPILLMGLGYAIDIGYWRFRGIVVQTATDGAATTAAMDVANGRSISDAQISAQSEAQALGLSSNLACDVAVNSSNYAAGCVVINRPPMSGPHAGDSAYLEALAAEEEPRFFSGIISTEPEVINSRAVVAMPTGGFNNSGCLVALDPTASKAINIDDSLSYFWPPQNASDYGIAPGMAATATPNPTQFGGKGDCEWIANSTASDSVFFNNTSGGDAVMAAITTAGGVEGNDPYFAQTVKTYQTPFGDPFAWVAAAMPTPGPCLDAGPGPTIIDGNINPGDNYLPLGHYCYGIRVINTGHVIFSPWNPVDNSWNTGPVFIDGELSTDISADQNQPAITFQDTLVLGPGMVPSFIDGTRVDFNSAAYSIPGVQMTRRADDTSRVAWDMAPNYGSVSYTSTGAFYLPGVDVIATGFVYITPSPVSQMVVNTITMSSSMTGWYSYSPAAFSVKGAIDWFDTEPFGSYQDTSWKATRSTHINNPRPVSPPKVAE